MACSIWLPCVGECGTIAVEVESVEESSSSIPECSEKEWEPSGYFVEKLHKTGREMQERIMDLLVVVENEDVTVELIQVNEDLNNAILGYESVRTMFIRNQQRILEQNKNQREDANTSSEPSAPSSDLLDLSPSPLMHRASLGELNTLNAQLSDLRNPTILRGKFNRTDGQNVLKPSNKYILCSRFQLSKSCCNKQLETQSSSTRGFASLRKHRNTPFPEYSNSVLLQPVTLKTIPATPSNQRLPSLPSNHPAMTKNDFQPPNYHEVMEFDPLAPAVTTE
eukprot:bmy_20455T0